MENETKRQMLVTTALPYANGPLHLGHLVEHTQADIWVRFQKMRGHDCLFICGDDAHGTPMMLSAEKQGISPEALVEKTLKAHRRDFEGFYIGFDNYYTTHSPENQAMMNTIYQRLCDNNDIEKRTIEQAYDAEKAMFLPDRFVKGECPKCGAKDQYGDNCEACGATYSPTDLKNPISVLSGTKPVNKPSEHYFFCLDHYETQLRDWIAAGHLQEEVSNKLMEWFDQGLQQWDISRDAPYFGFEIPEAPGKYFYVWLDAPVGYMASFQDLCNRTESLSFEDYWGSDSTIELFHFIGKDIIYFHALFWPAMLMGANFRTPSAVYAHGFLTIEGQKMSKSRGTFITAADYLEALDPEYLRYYLAAKLGNRLDDINLHAEDFMHRVNSDLIGKVINIASRSAKFIERSFNGKLAGALDNPALLENIVNAGEDIAACYEARDFNKAMRAIMALADQVNQYIDGEKPWTLAKEDPQNSKIQAVCSMGIHCFARLMTYLKPVLPNMAEKVEDFLNIEPLTWEKTHQPLLGHTIKPFKPLMQRMELAKIQSLLPPTQDD